MPNQFSYIFSEPIFSKQGVKQSFLGDGKLDIEIRLVDGDIDLKTRDFTWMINVHGISKERAEADPLLMTSIAKVAQNLADKFIGMGTK